MRAAVGWFFRQFEDAPWAAVGSNLSTGRAVDLDYPKSLNNYVAIAAGVGSRSFWKLRLVDFFGRP